LNWENTKVAIPVVADNDKRITDYLEKSINEPKRPYQQAANYYLETGKDLNKALAYTDKAIEENKEAFWLYWLKARIYQKQGNKKEAIAAAQKSATLAASTPYAGEYQRNAENLAKQMQ
jgi:tetratricopeptide (TPR) repeat protein